MKKISKMKSSKLGSTGSGSIQGPISSSSLMNGKGKTVGLGTLSSGTNGASSQQDDSNLKLIRDLCHVESNRYCFDCGQRGPTYVDVTIGSFVCMTCSGLLRGLTPPHRVKSISMTSFTPEEIELLKSRGNEYCRKVWLATYRAKDTQLNSNDPDRLNSLKSLMSAKYEQKSYYVDPSQLSKAELTEIQGKNVKALLGGSQNSPSSTHSNPSPILNNLRSCFNSLHDKGKPRIVNSMTLPDIKPLSSLDPAMTLSALNADFSTMNFSSPSSSSGVNTTTESSRPKMNGVGTHPTPINFINNLVVPTTNGNVTHKSQSNDHFQLPSSWESVTAPDQTSTHSSQDLNSNFADFDDAFNNTNTMHGNSGTNGYSNGFGHGPTTNGGGPQLSQKLINGGFIPQSMQTPLVPYANGEGVHPPSHALNNGFHHVPTSNGSLGSGSSDLGGDKYAALKDLDSLFKQHGDGVSGTSPLQNSTLTSSMSVPTNLSSSLSSTGGRTEEINGWLTTASPPNQNPFSTVIGNGWTTGVTSSGGTTNGLLHGCGLNLKNSGQNPHNPFYGGGNNVWSSSTTNGGNFAFNTNLGSTNNGLTPSHQHFRNEVEPVKAFNPFFQHQSPPQHTSNPTNPFL